MSPDRQSSIIEALYRTAEYYQEKGDVENAETQLKQALELSPSHVASRLLLARILVDSGRLDESLTELEVAYKKDADAARAPLVQALLAEGKGLDAEGKQDEALAAYERVIEIASDDTTAPARISDIWRKRAEMAVEAGDFDLALRSYTKANLPDQVERIEKLVRRRSIESDAAEARGHAEREEWEQACSRYKKLIEDDPGNEEWTQALGKAEAVASLAKSYSAGVDALDRSEWKKAVDAFLEILIVQADYKDTAHRLVQAVEKTARHQAPAADANLSAIPSDENKDIGELRAQELRTPGRLEMTWVLLAAALFALLATCVVVYFFTIPSSASASSQIRLPDELSSTDSWIIVYEQFLRFLAQERSMPMAPLALFVLLLTAGLAGWLACSFRLESGTTSDHTIGYAGFGEELGSVGIAQSSILGQAMRGHPSQGRPQAGPAPSSVGEVPPKNGAALVREPALSSLSNTELKDSALKLAEELRSFGRRWKLMADEAASYPPPKNDDSVQLYVDLIEKLGGFQEDFDKKYRKKISEMCASIQNQLPESRQPDNELSQAKEADDVEDAAQQLERMAKLL